MFIFYGKVLLTTRGNKPESASTKPPGVEVNLEESSAKFLVKGE